MTCKAVAGFADIVMRIWSPGSAMRFGLAPTASYPMMERAPCGGHRRKVEDEDQFKGLSRAGSRRGRPSEVADESGARVQVEGALSRAPGRARRAAELAAGASLRLRPLCRPADFSGDGYGRQGWRHQACDVRGQSARLPGLQLQASQPSRAATRFPLAQHP